MIFRKVEKLLKKAIKCKADINYLKFCATNQLLPSFTNFKLYDVSANHEPDTIAFKNKLIEREIDKHVSEFKLNQCELIRSVICLVRHLSRLKFYSSIFLLSRLGLQHEADVNLSHQKKLKSLYGGDVYLPQGKSIVINLSKHVLTDDENSVLNKGLNFGLKNKTKDIDSKIEMERLFYDITTKERYGKVVVNEKDNLKTKLKNFAITNNNDVSRDNLTQAQHRALKSLQRNEDIVVKRPDKGGGVVIMDRHDYNSKLENLISDPSKFANCNANQSEKIKSKINKIAGKYKGTFDAIYNKLHIVGNYPPGHLYGLPKVHKNPMDPPLRPIISMSGTVTHEVAKYLNEIIRPFINRRHMVNSTDEFFLNIQNIIVGPNQEIVSLDVTSLFTNVPVDETVDIIIEKCYNHPTLPPPAIDANDLRVLLAICTQETPFQYENSQYIQRDGVSMGSPLGPTFADFYMSNLENNLLNQQAASNPAHYFRFMDDTFTIFNRKSHIRYFVQRLESNSKLKFTQEGMKDNTISFLDISVKLENTGQLSTSIFTKPTDKGVYANFQSHIPLQYKKSVINSLVRRAIKFSSSWQSCSTELERIKQSLSNNGYPQNMVESIINRKLNDFSSPPTDNNIQDEVTFFVGLRNLSSFASQTKLIRGIIHNHVVPAATDSVVKICTYFKPYKLSSRFSTRIKCPDRERNCVVYRFDCPLPGCNAGYIGHTAQTLLNRVKQHRYISSSVCKHFKNDHDMENMLPVEELLKSFSIEYSSAEIIKIKIAEALIIKSEKPYINVKYDNSYNLLNLF